MRFPQLLEALDSIDLNSELNLTASDSPASTLPAMSDESSSLLHQFPYAPGYGHDNEVGCVMVGSSSLLTPPHPQAIDRVAAAPPLQNVTQAHLLRGYDNYKPPLLHFGWSFESRALLKWATENGIDTTERHGPKSDGSFDEEPNSVFAVTQTEVLEALAAKAGTPELRITFKLAIHVKGYFLPTISSNYRFMKDNIKRVTPERIEALDQYLEDSGIVTDGPAWHLDHELFKWQRIY